MKAPFFIINPKNYLNLEEILDIGLYAETLVDQYDVEILLTAPFPYLAILKQKITKLKIFSQHVDDVQGGVGMGKVSVSALKDIKLDGVVLNHAENPLHYNEISRIVENAKKNNINTIVCCDSVKEAEAFALLGPTVILCEPTELIGKGQTTDLKYVEETNRIIKNINPDILVEQAAGVSNGDDVYRLIMAGSDGTGATSGIVKADNPKETLKDMIEGLHKAKLERGL